MTFNARRQRRSQKGSPTPYLRADGRYALSIEAGRHPDGSRRRLPVYGRSADECRANAELHRQAIVAGDERRENPILATWADEWLAAIQPRWEGNGRREGIKHSSWRSYEMHVRLNIKPMLIGRTLLTELTSRQISEWLIWLRDRRGLSARSRQLAKTTLIQCLMAAKVQGYLSVLPTDGVKGPRVTAYKASIFTLEQARAFLRVIRGHPSEALYLVSAFAGPRQGETLSLMRDDINFETNVVTFWRTLDWIEGEPVIEENKTYARSVPLPPYEMERLRRHLEREDELRAAQGDKWTDFGLVFTRPNRHGGGDGYPLRAASVDRRLHAVLEANGLPRLRWHDFRHSAASFMLAMNMNLHDVQKTLGWSSLEMISQRYGHLVPELAAEQMQRLEELLIREVESE